MIEKQEFFFWREVSIKKHEGTKTFRWSTASSVQKTGIVNKHISSKVIKNIKPKNAFVTPVIEAAIKGERAALRALKKTANDCPSGSLQAI